MFRVSTRTRYGLRALIELAARTDEQPISLSELASRQDISKKYLESIFRSLQKHGIIKGIRGAEGGYELIVDADKLEIADIVIALEGPLHLVECTEDGASCPRKEVCSTFPMWNELENNIKKLLHSRVLSDLVNHETDCDNNFFGMYI